MKTHAVTLKEVDVAALAAGREVLVLATVAPPGYSCWVMLKPEPATHPCDCGHFRGAPCRCP